MKILGQSERLLEQWHLSWLIAEEERMSIWDRILKRKMTDGKGEKIILENEVVDEWRHGEVKVGTRPRRASVSFF